MANRELEQAAKEVRWAVDNAQKAGAAVVHAGVIYGAGAARRANKRAQEAKAKLCQVAQASTLSDDPTPLELAAEKYRNPDKGWLGPKSLAAAVNLWEVALMEGY